MERIYFTTHPEVVVDPNTPVPDWHLSDTGIKRAQEMLKQDWVSGIQKVFSSREQKAVDLGNVVSAHLDIPLETLQDLGEIDRSSTGYVGGQEFWNIVDEFFTTPNESARGWEKAIDVQNRTVNVVKKIIKDNPNKNIFIASHGGTGVLLNWYIKGVGIPKSGYELGRGGGYYFIFDPNKWKMIQDWRPIDE